MSEDLIQLAAYVIILIIIGGVAIIKKILEERKKRRLFEAQRAPIEHSRGLRPPSEQPHPLIIEKSSSAESPSPMAEKEDLEETPPEFDIEEILRRMFEPPSEELPQRRKRKRTLTQPSSTSVPVSPVSKEVKEVKIQKEEPKPSVAPIEKLPPVGNWEDFIQNLDAQGLSELQKGIIFAEVLAPPVAFRLTTWYRRRGGYI